MGPPIAAPPTGAALPLCPGLHHREIPGYPFQRRLSKAIQTSAPAPGPECHSTHDAPEDCHLTGS